MPIMRDIKMTLAAAITAAGISTATMSQDANADQVASANPQGNPVVQLAYNDISNSGKYIKASSKFSAGQDIPDTELKFRRARIGGKVVEITPDLVKKFAAKGQVKMPIVREEKPIMWGAFNRLTVKRGESNKAGIIIGVVVDDKPYTPLVPGYNGRDHFRDVHKKVVELMTGREAGGGKIVQGYAERFGAEVLTIIPITYEKDNVYRIGSIVNKGGFDEIPVNLNDIIIARNDHIYSANHTNFMNSIKDLEVALYAGLHDGYNLYSKQEFIKNGDKIRAWAREEYGPVIPYLMFSKGYDEFLAKNEIYNGGSSSTGGSGKGDSNAPDVVSILSHN